MARVWILDNNNHTWAFYYYLKRAGDDPMVHTYEDKVRIVVERGEDDG